MTAFRPRTKRTRRRTPMLGGATPRLMAWGGGFVAALAAVVTMTVAPSQVAAGGGVPSNVLVVDGDIPVPGNGSGWTAAFAELQDALDAALASGGAIDEIWVRASDATYVPGRRWGQSPGGRDASFVLHDGLAIFGGFAGGERARAERDPGLFAKTVLSGDRLSDDEPDLGRRSDNSQTVVFAQNVGRTAILDGFAVRGGYADSPGRTPAGSGGGVYLLGASPVIANCSIEDNAAFLGGGLAAWTDSAPLVRRCDFIRNGFDISTGGAVYLFERSHATIRECRFSRNRALVGAGVFNELCNPRIDGSRFERNTSRTHGGAIASESGVMRIARCRFLENSSSDGGAVYADGELRVADSLFAANEATAAGGAIVAFRDAAIARSTFAANLAAKGGAVWFQSNGMTAIEDSILWGNRVTSVAKESAQLGGSFRSVVHCCIENLPPALAGGASLGASVVPRNGPVQAFGNFGVDPGFRNAEARDFRLRDDSPYLDSGRPRATVLGGPALSAALDLDGRLREVRRSPQGDIATSDIDLGAFEVQPAPDYEAGAVDGGRPVLFVNGSTGGDLRWIEVAPSTPFSISLTSASDEPVDRYMLAVWEGADRRATDLRVAEASIGALVGGLRARPGEDSAPAFCLVAPGVGADVPCDGRRREGPGLSWTVERQLDGPRVFTIQGILEDPSAAHPSGYSVTNAITLSIAAGGGEGGGE